VREPGAGGKAKVLGARVSRNDVFRANSFNSWSISRSLRFCRGRDAKGKERVRLTLSETSMRSRGRVFTVLLRTPGHAASRRRKRGQKWRYFCCHGQRKLRDTKRERPCRGRERRRKGNRKAGVTGGREKTIPVGAFEPRRGRGGRSRGSSYLDQGIEQKNKGGEGEI